MLVANAAAVLASMLVAAQASGTAAAASSADGAAPASQAAPAGAESGAAAPAPPASAVDAPAEQGVSPAKDAAAASRSPSPATPPAPSPSSHPAAPPAAEAAVAPDAAADATVPRFSVEAGGSFVGSTAALGMGFSVRLLTHGESLLLSQSIDRLVGARTIGMLGFGAEHRTARGWSLLALALGGFDVVAGEGFGLRPAAGARVGIEWPVRYRFVQVLDVSVTGVTDLTRGRDSVGERPPLVTTWLTMSAGFGFSPR